MSSANLRMRVYKPSSLVIFSLFCLIRYLVLLVLPNNNVKDLGLQYVNSLNRSIIHFAKLVKIQLLLNSEQWDHEILNILLTSTQFASLADNCWA